MGNRNIKSTNNTDNSNNVCQNFHAKIDYSREIYEFDAIKKILIIGDEKVGKTQILSRYTKNEFCEEYSNAISVDFATKTFAIDDKFWKLQMWDHNCVDGYSYLMKHAIKSTEAIIIVYDVTNKESFNNIQKYLKVLNDNNYYNKIFIVGNKCDLEKQITLNEVKSLYPDISIFEISAKTSENIDKLFESIILDLYDNKSGSK